MWKFIFKQAELGRFPDFLIRFGIRYLCKKRLSSLSEDAFYAEKLKNSPLAIKTDLANKQHYEVPASFFDIFLGSHKKYSSAYWEDKTTTLEKAEQDALNITMERAELKDGQKILELGCGWGSLTLTMAKKFPNAQIIAISNSKYQREYIENKIKSLGFKNVEIKTLDLSLTESLLDITGSVDRVVSIEMFEHFRNYEKLLKMISEILNQSGKLFVHIFTHKKYSYEFEVLGEDDWMSEYFFSGGQMPSQKLFYSFQNDLRVMKEWHWNGLHYFKTSEAWLSNLDNNKLSVIEIFKTTYGTSNATIWFNRWRLFLLSVSELFAFNKGNEWGVTHYLFEKQK